MSQTIRTNKINVTWNDEAFAGCYSIVAYWSDNVNQNLPYEQLSDTPCLSVAGIRARFDGQKTLSVRFFVLVKKGDEAAVRDKLRDNEYIKAKFEDLENYDDKLRSRIIASLAINSLGMKRRGKMMYCGGSLLVCDNRNFLISKSRKELVCLKIEVDEYLILTAKTASFSHPRDNIELKGHKNHVFCVSKEIGGNWWEGQSIQPVVIKDFKKSGFSLEELYIQKKYFPGNKNTVAYWPYRADDYVHGRLWVLQQVVDSVNKKFNDTISLAFEHHDVILHDASKTGKDTTALLHENLAGKSIFFDDEFANDGTRAIQQQFIEQAQEIMGGTLKFSQKQSAEDMVIRFCEPANANTVGTRYSKSIDRMARGVLQHIIYSGNEKEDKITKASARRILIELLVKDCLRKKEMPAGLVPFLNGWTLYEYKVINKQAVHGCSLNVSKEGKMNFLELGLSQNQSGEPYNPFIQQYLKFNDCDKINGKRDYKALIKDGNVYLIIDTDEIPILNSHLINEGYNKVVNENESLSMFKRKSEAPKYLEGYMKFHLWKSDGIGTEHEVGYSYISGTNAENMKFIKGAKMDKMPRVRKIFVLHADHPERVDVHIVEIKDMLKFGFGRWNEMMTYPFPFKFTYEYLDNVCETFFSKHWNNFS